MCLVMASRAPCVQRSFQKDIRSSPEATGDPHVVSGGLTWVLSQSAFSQKTARSLPRSLLAAAGKCLDCRGAGKGARPASLLC